jgi:phosphoenolpyruvate synthase/pyruvate phosphate dikinase
VWLPFQVAVILASGERRVGAPSGPGLAAGRLAVVADATRPIAVDSRDVIVAPRPLPHLAPLLWDAAAIVTAGGGPGAHLFESARAIGLPAVSGIGRDDLLDTVLADPEPWAIAVDGSAGTVAVTPW